MKDLKYMMTAICISDLNLAENHYCSMENAYRMMNQYFENMKRHILSIKDII